MDDEPLILGIEIMGDDAGLRQLKDMAQQMRLIGAGMDSATAKAAKFSKALHDANSIAGQFKSPTLHLPVMSGGGAGGSLPGGSGGMPGGALISKLGSMIAPELAELSNPIGIAVAGITALASAAKSAADSLISFKDAQVVSGGTASEVAGLNAYGAAAGVNDMAALSRQVADRLATNPSAAGFAAGIGVHDYGGAYSDLDKARNLSKLIDHILDPRVSAQEAARFARVEGLEQFVKMRDLSAQTKQHLIEAQNLSGGAHNDAAIKQAMEFNTEMAALQMNFDSIGTSLGSQVLPGLSGYLKMMNTLAPSLNSAAVATGTLLRAFSPLLSFGEAMGALSDKLHGDKSEHDDKLGKNTDALDKVANALKNGTYGGGQRARNAVPSAWGGSNFRDWSDQTRALGGLG